eukprot:1156299-Pelagomonas_calceolata.AAC.6
MHVYNTLIYVSLLHPESSVLACDSITMREVSKVEEEDAAFNAPLRAVPWPAVVPNLGWVHTADVYSLVLDQFKARMSLPVAVDAFCPFSNCNALFFLPFALSLSVQAAFGRVAVHLWELGIQHQGVLNVNDTHTVMRCTRCVVRHALPHYHHHYKDAHRHLSTNGCIVTDVLKERSCSVGIVTGLVDTNSKGFKGNGSFKEML